MGIFMLCHTQQLGATNLYSSSDRRIRALGVNRIGKNLEFWLQKKSAPRKTLPSIQTKAQV